MNASHLVSSRSSLSMCKVLLTLAFLAALNPVLAAAQEPVPALPRVYVDTTWNPPNGATWNVNSSSTLTLALNHANPGDTIVLSNSSIYSGNFTLPAKTNPNGLWIYIETSGLSSLPPPGTRINPQTQEQYLAKVTTPNVSPAFTLAPGANHYRLIGLEITTGSTQGGNQQNNPPSNNFTYCLVCWNPALGSAEPDSITIDRSYVHGSPTQDVGQGIQCNASNCAVIDSYISDIHEATDDSQAVLVYWSPGPIKIVDNYLSATTEDLMFGGAGGYNDPYVPSDIEIRNNHMFKPLTWDSCGVGGTVPPGSLLANGTACPPSPSNQWEEKNNLEIKSGQRMLISGNIMENTWVSAQTGSSVLFTVRTSQSGNIAVVDDITFENNQLVNVDSGFSTLEEDDQCNAQDGYPQCTNPGESKRVKIYDNLVLLQPSLDTTHHMGIVIDGGNATDSGLTDYIFQHNTLLMSDQSTLPTSIYFSLPQLNWGCTPPPNFSSSHNLWILDNALAQEPDGDCGFVGADGVTGLAYYMGDPNPLAPRFFGNAIFAPRRVYTYPANNDVTSTAFTYVNPGGGDYQLLVPDWTDTSDGKLAGIDWPTLQQESTVLLTSGEDTLYETQSTALNAIVSVEGANGAPTGTMTFMLGSTALGTANLTAIDGNDSSASMQLRGSLLNLGPNSITAVYSGDGNYTGSTSPSISVTLLGSDEGFGTVSVGVEAPVQSLTYTFNSNAQLSAINILTLGVSGLDYKDGGSSTCSVGTAYTAGQSCTVSVAFTPSAPGLRAGSVTLFVQGTNQPLNVWYLSGIGESPAVTIDPGTQTTTGTIANAATYGSAIDGAGNAYVADQANGQVVKIAVGTLQQTVIVSQLSAPTSVALDGAGNLYIAESSGVVMVPNENGTLNPADMVTLPITGLGLAQGIAEDGNGNLYVADSGTGNVIEVPGGWGDPVTIASGLTNPHGVAVDSAGNVYASSDNQVSEYPAGGGAPIPMGTGYSTPQDVAVDASGTVYVADTGNAQIVKVAVGGGSQSVLPVAGLVAPHGVTLDASGDVYVSDSSSVYEVNRVQAAALNFGTVPIGTSSSPQTLQVSNIGNQELAVSGLALSTTFTQQASGGTDCSSSSQLTGGGGCAIAIIFTPATSGVVNGTMTLTDNTLNTPSSQQTVSLTGTGVLVQQQPQTITFPNPGTQTYGVAPITLTATATSGLPVSYTVLSGPAVVSGNVLTITGAGSVTVQANQPGNYAWLPAPPVNDTFTVNPAVLTVTANNASMTYGGTLPTFTATYSGFVNGDGQGVLSGAPSLTTTATAASPTGNYTITAAQGTLSAQNYTFNFVNGTLTINPALLTVTANSASMIYGSVLPTFTASYSGFQNGDGQGVLQGAPSLTTTATSASPLGNYTIVAAQGTLSAQNYVFAFVNGTLTITPAASATVATSGISSLYEGEATTLTGTVTVVGLGGAPSGTVNFMLGTTVLGTATLTAIDGNDASASMQLHGSQLSLGANNITAVYSGNGNYIGSTSSAITVTLLSSDESFGAVNVGVPAPVQTMTYTFNSDAQLTAINILTMGTSGLDYQDGGSSTCTAGTPYTAGQSCTVSVAFTPSAPGLRAGSVTLFAQGTNQPLNTWYLSGVGQSPAVTIDPGTQTTMGSITNAATYGSAIDGAGNAYVADQANGQVVKIAAGTLQQSVIVSQLSAPTSVALDGAGNLFIAESSGVVMVPNENGTLNPADMVTLQIAGLGVAQGIAEDGNGNLYVADSGTGKVIEVQAGTGTVVTWATGLTNPHGVAVDSAGNVYVSSDNQVSEYPTGGGAPIPMGTGYHTPQDVAVDASGTVYVADTGNAQIVKVAVGGGSQSVVPVAGLVAPHGVMLDATGNVYVSDSSSLYEVNRVQAATLNFGNVTINTTSPPQTLQVSNIGNQQLTVSALAISTSFVQQPSGGTDCSSSSHLTGGGGCAIAVAFAPTTTGVVNGTVTLTDNALNNNSSQQTVGLTGTGMPQQSQTITFPNPGTQTYGVAPITLTATATSGLPVSYTVLSGPAVVSGSVLTITGAGTVMVQANQAGNAQWLPAPPVNDSFTVNQAVLTVTADNATRQYGQDNPTLTYTMTGFVNGDTQGTATSGAPSLSTTATPTSPVGNYTITITQGTLTAQNYSFVLVNGTLTITQATVVISWIPQTLTVRAGQMLGPAGVLDATVSPNIAGSMRYSTGINQHIVALLPPSGLPVGVFHVIVAFTPQDGTDYATPAPVVQTITAQ